MERLSTCDLKNKDVINLCDGTRIGYPSDFEFNICDGRITAIVITRPGGVLGLGRCKDLIIPWCKIECIGEDTILVKLQPNECCISDEKDKRRTKIF